MANEIVKYRNEMNLIPMKNYTSTELDIFFSICAKLKEKQTLKVELTFAELRVLSNYKSTSIERFVKDLDSAYDKMLEIKYGEEQHGELKKFLLFSGYHRSVARQTVTISVNPDMVYMLNNIENQFTRFELEIFTNLKSFYSKTMFRLLKQYRSTGFYKVKIEDFMHIMDVPDTYNMSRITQRVLKPIEKELKPLYKYLTIEKIIGKGSGGKVTHLEFNFKEKEQIQVPLFKY